MRGKLDSSTWRKKSEAAESPRGDFGVVAAICKEWKDFRVEGRRPRAFIRPAQGPGDPAITRDAPADPGTCAGRPGGV
jgi:hypothetical protein